MNSTKATDSEIAVERVVGFAQQFDGTHLDLACHAAFPQTLTPDLLYQIWLRFVPKLLGRQLLAYFYLACAVR
jgi:hypothetical protein